MTTLLSRGARVTLVAIGLLELLGSTGCAVSGVAPRATQKRVEVRVSIPEADDAGHPFDASHFEWLENQFARRYGGWTNEGLFPGGVFDGRQYTQKRSRRYMIVVERSDLSDLIRFLREVKQEFYQGTLHVSFTESHTLAL
jgi:hypothetical protein